MTNMQVDMREYLAASSVRDESYCAVWLSLHTLLTRTCDCTVITRLESCSRCFITGATLIFPDVFKAATAATWVSTCC
jgi:hypothetical protein